ncbi:hypothetical protein GCM10027592_32480 [Spirosoma flavus]
MIQNYIHGFVSANVNELIDSMTYVVANPDKAKRLGDNARQLALDRFGLTRFVDDWNAVFADVTT